MDELLWQKIDEEEPIPDHIRERMEECRRKGMEVIDEKYIKRPSMIQGIRDAGVINTGVLDEVAKLIKPGMRTSEIDDIVREYTHAHNAVCAPYKYEGFPKSVCTSVNSEVCHGIPSRLCRLKDGDIVNVDCTTILNGYYADASRMFMIGNVSPERKRLVEETKKCLEIGIEAAQPWNTVGDIGYAISKYARSLGYSVVRELGGHGVGLEFHEDPFVSYVSKPGQEMLMVPGMVFTIEPMVNMGTDDIYQDDKNGWTIYTRDGKPSAQWEIQVLVTETGHEVLCW